MRMFETPGRVNTEETCRIAVNRAMQIKSPIVASSTSGASGAMLCEIASGLGFDGKIVIVTHAYGSMEPGKNMLMDEHRETMQSHGAVLVTAAHALSGAERGLSTRFQGIYPVEIVAHTLRMISQGLKVSAEIGSMALDAGAIEYGKEAVCMGGAAGGLDTAVVMTPSHANRIMETNVHEILCMPY